jgi:hypothetical protein
MIRCYGVTGEVGVLMSYVKAGTITGFAVFGVMEENLMVILTGL